jgi:hypothetical protein
MKRFLELFFVSWLVLAASGSGLKETLSIERSKVDGSFQRVSPSSQTYAEYSVEFTVPTSLSADVQVRLYLASN